MDNTDTPSKENDTNNHHASTLSADNNVNPSPSPSSSITVETGIKLRDTPILETKYKQVSDESSEDNSPTKKRTAKITPITPSKVSIRSSSSIDEQLEATFLPSTELSGVSLNMPSVIKSTPRSSRRKSIGRDSSGKSRRNSNQISPTSMIFRNLLIMEEDLRNQAREQKKLRWQYTAFLACLAGVAGFSVYELYFNDDVVKGMYRFFIQFTMCFISITLVLFHLSGQYKRTIIIPRRFFASTNKGIRQFNLRLVKVHSSWDENLTDMIRFAMNAFSDSNIWLCEELLSFWKPITLLRFWHNVKVRCQPRIGAVDVKIVLNPRAFSAEIREGWEIYRDEFWARDGARRRKTVNESKPKSE
ncbi:Nem1-Spo7 phosphatase regulatory subunit [Maudiozyma exigua]|uniref:Nem1-Spo7 phosphatase regulatory subunit n=1 Tax=Maudiozyma exigua TaxID=34358 RepID=A0A9P6WCB7_MAUEX|nr:Nem1-Spo7 phosphatase regulatory subunit [Kazachstania exigua]